MMCPSLAPYSDIYCTRVGHYTPSYLIINKNFNTTKVFKFYYIVRLFLTALFSNAQRETRKYTNPHV